MSNNVINLLEYRKAKEEMLAFSEALFSDDIEDLICLDDMVIDNSDSFPF